MPESNLVELANTFAQLMADIHKKALCCPPDARLEKILTLAMDPLTEVRDIFYTAAE